MRNPGHKLGDEIKKYKAEDNHKNPIRELDDKLKWNNYFPQKGWINTIRTSISMSLKQMAARIEEPIFDNNSIVYKKTPISPQAILEFEKAEVNGTITLNSMRKMARALGMDFKYSFHVPYSTVTDMVKAKAESAAWEFYNREENKSILDELQRHWKENSRGERINKELDNVIHKKKMEIIIKHLKTLWD
jgi:transcriptional regulator with XRE-family HTH domain